MARLASEMQDCLNKLLLKRYQSAIERGVDVYLENDDNFKMLGVLVNKLIREEDEIVKVLSVGIDFDISKSMTEVERTVHVNKIKLAFLQRQTVALENMASIMQELKGMP